MPEAPRRLVVGRLRKPHGLKGEVTLFPLTDRPEDVFRPGQRLDLVNVGGDVQGEAVVVERSRPYHREWLLKFRGIESREDLAALPPFRGMFVAAPAEALPPPDEGEVFYHDLIGFAVELEDGAAVGLVTAFYEPPSGVMLEIQGSTREFLLPFVKAFVLAIDRDRRRLTIRPPDGLLEE
jgi:16S rRNA processing protein RimM